MGFFFSKIGGALLFLSNCVFVSVYAEVRPLSYPFISGDTLRDFADYVFDDTVTAFNPREVMYGDVIFVKTDCVKQFFQHKHPHIVNPYVLITHNSDVPIPGDFAQILDDPKILAWFGQNVEGCSHPKLLPIPSGLANRKEVHGDINTLSKVRARAVDIPRDNLLYLNSATDAVSLESNQSFKEYLLELASSKFVLTPKNNGYQTWEALYMGAIPIVKTSAYDSLYEDLPVVIVQDWDEVTQEFLEKTYEEMSLESPQFAKLRVEYWQGQLAQYKKSRKHALIKMLQPEKFFFSQEPIDVVIPCVAKDLCVLPACIESIRKRCHNVRRIIVVSSEKLSANAEWFNEAEYPFSKRDIAVALTGSEEEADNYLKNPRNRAGWFCQQLLKLYAPYVIPDISSNVLVVDADVIFFKQVVFQNSDGGPLFNVGCQYHEPYYEHMNRLIGLTKVYPQWSGITHQMLFQTPILDRLFQTVEELHGEPFWKAFCHQVTAEEIWLSGASEYEIYFNFAMTKCPDLQIRPLRNADIVALRDIKIYYRQRYDYGACHSYLR